MKFFTEDSLVRFARLQSQVDLSEYLRDKPAVLQFFADYAMRLYEINRDLALLQQEPLEPQKRIQQLKSR